MTREEEFKDNSRRKDGLPIYQETLNPHVLIKVRCKTLVLYILFPFLFSLAIKIILKDFKLDKLLNLKFVQLLNENFSIVFYITNKHHG